MLKVGLAIVAVAAYIYFLVDVVRSERRNVRALPKFVWLAIVVLVPIVGGVIWTFAGRPRYSSARRAMAPDDDVTFMRGLEEQAWRERMRRLRGNEE